MGQAQRPQLRSGVRGGALPKESFQAFLEAKVFSSESSAGHLAKRDCPEGLGPSRASLAWRTPLSSAQRTPEKLLMPGPPGCPIKTPFAQSSRVGAQAGKRLSPNAFFSPSFRKPFPSRCPPAELRLAGGSPFENPQAFCPFPETNPFSRSVDRGNFARIGGGAQKRVEGCSMRQRDFGAGRACKAFREPQRLNQSFLDCDFAGGHSPVFSKNIITNVNKLVIQAPAKEDVRGKRPGRVPGDFLGAPGEKIAPQRNLHLTCEAERRGADASLSRKIKALDADSTSDLEFRRKVRLMLEKSPGNGDA